MAEIDALSQYGARLRSEELRSVIDYHNRQHRRHSLDARLFRGPQRQPRRRRIADHLHPAPDTRDVQVDHVARQLPRSAHPFHQRLASIQSGFLRPEGRKTEPFIQSVNGHRSGYLQHIRDAARVVVCPRRRGNRVEVAPHEHFARCILQRPRDHVQCLRQPHRRRGINSEYVARFRRCQDLRSIFLRHRNHRDRRPRRQVSGKRSRPVVHHYQADRPGGLHVFILHSEVEDSPLSHCHLAGQVASTDPCLIGQPDKGGPPADRSSRAARHR